MSVATVGQTSAYFAGGQLKNGSKSDVVDVFTVSVRDVVGDAAAPSSSLLHSVLKLSSARSMLAATVVDGPSVTSQYSLSTTQFGPFVGKVWGQI